MKVLKEFSLEDGDKELKVGDKVTVSNFEGVKYVDVTGVTKGKGFAGVIKRYGFAGGNMTHGGHSKRRTGGLAARDLPGWIEKGKKMPGHMGDVNRKAMNLEVVAVRCRDASAPSGIERLYEERIRLWIWSKFSARST